MPDFGGNVASRLEFNVLLAAGLQKVFQDDLPTHPVLFKAWLKTESAKQFTEYENVVSAFGPMPEKGIGGVFSTDKPKLGDTKSMSLTTYGLGFVAEYELIRWEKYGVFSKMTRKLARSGVDRKNVIAYAILNNAFTATAPYTTYNGEALIATSHALLRGGTFGNRPAVATGLSYLGMQEAITNFSLMVNEDGLYVMLDPSTLVCHPAKRWEAETILGSQYRPDNANQSLNTLKDRLTPHSAPYLSSQTAWFVLSSKDKLEIAFHVGDDLMFRDDYDQSTWNNMYSMYASYRVAVLHWYGTWGTPGV